MKYSYKIKSIIGGYLLISDMDRIEFFKDLNCLLASALRQYVYSFKNTLDKDAINKLELKIEWEK